MPVSFSPLLQDMANIGAKYIWIAFNKQADWGFKRARINTLRQEYEKELENFRGRISGKVLTHRLDAKSAEGTFIVLEDMFATMRDPRDNSPRLPASGPPKKDLALQRLVEREIAQDDIDPEVFWEYLQNGVFIDWSHYNLIKALCMVVLQSVEERAINLLPSVGSRETCFDIASTFGRYMNVLSRTSPRWFEKTRHK